jgi:hypothetical protein
MTTLTYTPEQREFLTERVLNIQAKRMREDVTLTLRALADGFAALVRMEEGQLSASELAQLRDILRRDRAEWAHERESDQASLPRLEAGDEGLMYPECSREESVEILKSQIARSTHAVSMSDEILQLLDGAAAVAA